MATLPGLQLYRTYGFAPVGEQVLITLPDGATAECLNMTKPVSEVPVP